MSGTRAELDQVLEVIRTAQKALGAARRRVEEQLSVVDGQGVLDEGDWAHRYRDVPDPTPPR